MTCELMGLSAHSWLRDSSREMKWVFRAKSAVAGTLPTQVLTRCEVTGGSGIELSSVAN
jgi:hypothetical protein